MPIREILLMFYRLLRRGYIHTLARWLESELEINRLRHQLKKAESAQLAAEKESSKMAARNAVLTEKNEGLVEALGEAWANELS